MNKNSSSHSQNRAKNQSHKRRTDEENENTFSREKFKFFIYRVGTDKKYTVPVISVLKLKVKNLIFYSKIYGTGCELNF